MTTKMGMNAIYANHTYSPIWGKNYKTKYINYLTDYGEGENAQNYKKW